MELVAVVIVAHEEHVAAKRVETVAHPDVVVAGLTGKGSLDLALRVVFGFQLVDVVMAVDQELVYHMVGVLAEHAVHDPA